MITIKEQRGRRIKKWFSQFKNPFTVIAAIILVVYSATLIYAIFWGLVTSLKSRTDFAMNLFGFPKKLMFSNYITAFNKLFLTVNYKKIYMPQLLLNSVIFAGGQSVITVFSTAMCAYVCNKYKCRVTKLMYSVVIVMMILPIVSSLGASIQFHKTLGIYDNLLGIFWTCIGFNTGNFLVSYAMFTAISWTYAEAAFMDGATHWGVMIKIMFPLVSVPISILLVLAFVGNWNNYMTPLIYLPSFPTLAVALYQFQWLTEPEISSTPIQMAAAMVVCFPCIVVFLAMKDKMVGNLTMGGIKG